MNKDKKSPGFLNIGTSLLMVVFLSISLVTFAVLALSSAKADMTFSNNLAGHKTAYYEASSRAELIYAKLDTLSRESSQLEDILLEDVSVVYDGESNSFSYEVKVDDRSHLFVELSVTEKGCDITAWQLRSSGQWTGDNSLELLPMGD